MKGIKTYQSQRFEKGTLDVKEEALTEESPLRILINGDPFTVTMRTPGFDRELVLGLLYNEDVIRNSNGMTIEISTEEAMDTAMVTIPNELLKEGYMNARNFLSVSSCGVCGKTDLPKLSGRLSSSQEIQHQLILDSIHKMQEQQKNYDLTGGCHAAAVLDANGKMIAHAEDIGRHNAVDKVTGQLLFNNDLNSAKTLLVSGRVSYEIVIKCFRSKIPTLAAVSAPSSLAIDYAKELGIAVFAFCRQTRLTQFS